MDQPAPLPPLGVTRLVGQSFALFFRHFAVFGPIALVPSVVVGLVQLAVLSDAALLGRNVDALAALGPVLASIGLSLVVGLVVMAMTTLAAYDIRTGRSLRMGQHLRRTLSAALPIAILGFLFYLAFLVGLALLVLPGLYLMARYWVMAPAVLVEGAGFSGLSRAAELSRGYRWPILGAVLLLFVLLLLATIGVTLLLGVAVDVALSQVTNQPGIMPALLFDTVTTALHYAILSIFTALLYARLREVKEGLGFEDLAKVFE
ncbi:hypothetical protein HMH01_13895 [Halovulum dunhuangense]|uniref:Glycerophosphoryl diester phosphodiesterase membrane domain-containing protein n=1 Tax=Halovulum dunhuangense TaxID=1505036 RepID=A0A849L510_9RHOB|nr:hypothetical protein [Halovulum dunhuangense]NNU81528.1 hypothetical protein [Halovulum dunhuangense]